MSCTCPTSHRDRLRKVRSCFTQGLSEFAGLPGAFSIARNGGCEQTLRNLLLHRLEGRLACVAFTEVHRLDVLLVCRKCGDVWAVIEWKSNFEGQPQMAARYEQEGRDQVAWYRARFQPAVAFFIQMGTRVVAGNGRASLACQLHDELSEGGACLPPYKRFRDGADGAAQIELPGSRLSVRVDGSHGDFATISCWLSTVDHEGVLHPA